MPRKTIRDEGGHAGEAGPASMRPRPDAAENRSARPRRVRSGRRFNEAAARCRGKPGDARTANPRVFRLQ